MIMAVGAPCVKQAFRKRSAFLAQHGAAQTWERGYRPPVV
jgi:hypothetical protein